MPASYLQTSRVAPPTGLSSPSNPTIIGVSVIDITRGSDGRPQKRITVTYTPPGTLGTFTGVNVYLDHPDSSGALDPADGTVAADGTIAASGGFAPDNIGLFPYDAANPSVVFEVDPPSTAEYWRVYLTPSANNTQLPVVQYGLPGASPSYQFIIGPPAAPYQGREFAPVVTSPALSSTPTGWTANPNIEMAASGDQYFEFRVTWSWPTFDQNFQTVGGVNISLDDGVSRKVIGQVWMPASVVAGTASVEADALFASAHITVLPGSKPYKIWIVSFNKSGQVNTIVDGITPQVDITITRDTGTSGQEYCALVTTDGVHALVTVAPIAGADGTSLLRVTGYFSPPSDPAFGGAEIVVDKGDGVIRTIKSGRLSPVESDISQPATVQSWVFYIRSIDINGLRNTVVSGVTPSITLSVGTTAGALNLSKAGVGFDTTQFSTSSGDFKAVQIDAGIILTGILQVGYTGSTVSKLEVFDTLGSIIGFIGDDTGGSGYSGAWFKQVRIGGASPSAAPLQCDTSGNLSITGGSIKITNFGGSGIVTDITQGFDASFGHNYGMQIKSNSTNERLDLGTNAVYLLNSSSQLMVSLVNSSGGLIAVNNSAGNTSVTLDGANSQVGVNQAGGGGNKVLLGFDGSSNGYVKINGTQVLSTRVGTTPATLADVIAVLQHHGLSN